jgi:hypothetical protein
LIFRTIRNAPSAARIGHAAEGACQAGAETEYCDHGAPVLNRNNAGAQKTKYSLLSNDGILHMPTCAVARFVWSVDSWGDAITHSVDDWSFAAPKLLA